MSDFAGLAVIVTGGASGTGMATAKLLRDRAPGSPRSSSSRRDSRTTS